MVFVLEDMHLLCHSKSEKLRMIGKLQFEGKKKINDFYMNFDLFFFVESKIVSFYINFICIVNIQPFCRLFTTHTHSCTCTHTHKQSNYRKSWFWGNLVLVQGQIIWFHISYGWLQVIVMIIWYKISNHESLNLWRPRMGRCYMNQKFKNDALLSKNRWHLHISPFTIHSIIKLLKEFWGIWCIKCSGTSLRWTPVISDPSDSTPSRPATYQWPI